MARVYYTYIMSSGKNGTLYVGVTNNLQRRVLEHRSPDIKQGFTQKYNVTSLVYYEETGSIEEAIYREKQLKHWGRDWKLNLIESINPNWIDLAEDFL